MVILESILVFVLKFFYGLTHSYELSLILLSAFVSLSLAPLYHLTGILEKKERTIKQRLAMYKPSTHRNLNELYEQFGYWPFYSIRSLASLFIQIPVLIAAYDALSDYAPLKNTWLGYPDNIIAGLNIFPFIMTFINLCAVFISSEPQSKERKQGIFIAIVFFGLLYTSPVALLIYWTFNQLFTLVRYLIVYPFPKIKRPNLNLDFAWQFLLVLTIHSIFVILVDGKTAGVYWIFAFFIMLSVYKFATKIKIPFFIPNLKTIALNISVMAFPAILLFKSNEIYFSEIELIIYAAVLLLFSVFISFILSPKFSVSFILSLMFLPMAREITYHTADLRTAFFVLFVVVLIFVGSVIKQKGAIIAFSLLASIYLLCFTGNESSNFIKAGEGEGKTPTELLELELKDSASIYLFMHDAFPHKDYAKHLDLPNYNNLINMFEQNNFKIYDIYSMAYTTQTTMSSLFDIDTNLLLKYKGTATAKYDDIIKNPYLSNDFHPNYFKAIFNGNSFTNTLLQKKGYSTALLAPHSYEPSYKGKKTYNFVFYGKTSSVNDNENKIENQVLKNILNGNLNSNLLQDSLATSHLINIAEFARDNSKKTKFFMWGAASACPGHSSFGALGTTEKELEQFLPTYNKCLEAMKTEIEMLKANKNAIIIFMSDHGGYFMDNGIGYKLPKGYDFSKTDYMKFRDIFGAFMAVRWPSREKAEKYDSNFNVSQDLFPIIFAYLFDSEIPLKYKMKNTELRLGPHKFDRGVFYKDFYQDKK